MKLVSYAIVDAIKESKKISKVTARPALVIAIDIMLSWLLFGASPSNYSKFQFYNIEYRRRRTFVTNRISRKLIAKYNDPRYIDLFEDKRKFANRFAKFFGRDWISIPDCTEHEFKRFLVGKRAIVCKPANSSQGEGIRVLDVLKCNYMQIRNEYKSGGIIEDYITQHPDLNAVYDMAVNCIRVITIQKNGIAQIVAANVTFGLNNNIANASFGGITAKVDLLTGIISSHGGRFGEKPFDTHPHSNHTIKGVRIPYWREMIEMLKKASLIVREIGYIGWDIAITPSGPIIIEANTTPGYTFFQIPEITMDGCGVMDKYMPYL